MEHWAVHVGRVLQMLDPSDPPAKVLDRVWSVIGPWGSLDGVWVNCLPGHVQPVGTFLVGRCPDNADETAGLAAPTTASINTDGLPVVARQLRDGNVPIALILVSHHDAFQAASFLVDALARYLLDRLRMQLESSELVEENHYLRGELSARVMQHDIITVCGTMETLIRSAVRTASSNATVLIQGETGTGKELLARLIHSHSTRSHKPMVSVNAGAFSPSLLESELFGHARGAFTGAEHDRKGVFEIADGGTLFLDEVGELSLDAQVRLLRVLQERTVVRVGDHRSLPVDVRVIAATHRDLASEVARGRFRQDLYYRLNVVNLLVPALRERPEDVPILVNHFLQKYNRENYKQVEDVPREVLELLQSYPWPGNIRELENCVQKVVVMAQGRSFPAELIPPTIRSYRRDDVPPPPTHEGGPPLDPRDDLHRALERFAGSIGPDVNAIIGEVERRLITWALTRERGVKLRAAKLLGINRVTLDRKLAEYGMEVRRGSGVLVDEE
jgi:DNA-binding NtrC family response regulator